MRGGGLTGQGNVVHRTGRSAQLATVRSLRPVVTAQSSPLPTTTSLSSPPHSSTLHSISPHSVTPSHSHRQHSSHRSFDLLSPLSLSVYLDGSSEGSGSWQSAWWQESQEGCNLCVGRAQSSPVAPLPPQTGGAVLAVRLEAPLRLAAPRPPPHARSLPDSHLPTVHQHSAVLPAAPSALSPRSLQRSAAVPLQ